MHAPLALAPWVLVALGVVATLLGFLLALLVPNRGLVALARGYVEAWAGALKDGSRGVWSVKHMIYAHGAFFGAVMLAYAIVKQGGFTPQSVDAFNTFMYCTVGGYVFGKGAEALVIRASRGSIPAPASTPDAPPKDPDSPPGA